MTRAPRSRKQKHNHSSDASRPSAGGGNESLALSLPTEAPIDAEPAALAADSSPDHLAITAASEVESTPSTTLLIQPPIAASTMRVEVTEDRSHIGPRLRAAREARGWSRHDVASRLHVPTTVVADIEAEHFDRLGAPIYLRGYLTKYAALVGMPQVVVNLALEGLSEPLLKASTEAPRVAATWERYRVAVIGAVITLAVAVPVLTLVASRGINSPVPQVRSLDESELSDSMATVSAPLPAQAPTSEPMLGPPTPLAPSIPVESDTSAATVASAPIETTPNPIALESGSQNPALLASMTGFSTPPESGGHVVEVRFREDSWIEIFDAQGRAIEQDMVRAGQSRRYESTGALSIKVGNVGGVDLQADGNVIDLAAHARANVARLRLFEESPTP